MLGFRCKKNGNFEVRNGNFLLVPGCTTYDQKWCRLAWREVYPQRIGSTFGLE